MELSASSSASDSFVFLIVRLSPEKGSELIVLINAKHAIVKESGRGVWQVARQGKKKCFLCIPRLKKKTPIKTLSFKQQKQNVRILIRHRVLGRKTRQGKILSFRLCLKEMLIFVTTSK